MWPVTTIALITVVWAIWRPAILAWTAAAVANAVAAWMIWTSL